MRNIFLTLFILILVCNACQTNDKSASLTDLYNLFIEKGRIHKFENSALMFAPQTVDYVDLQNALQMDTSELSKEQLSVYRKGAFKLEDVKDTTVVFKYAVAKGRTIEELRFRTFRDGNFIEDKAVIKFKDNVDYDYYVLDDLIYVVGTNQKNEKHYTFYRIFLGNINQISFTPDTLFQKEKPFQREQFLNKEVVIYNDFGSKELAIEGTKKGKLTGKVIGKYGNKEIGFYEIVELNDNDIFDKILTHVVFSFSDPHFPKSLHSITKTEMEETDYEKLEVPVLIETDVFVEIVQ